MSQFNIDPTVKAEYLEQRLAQLNAEGYAHELNRKTAEAVGNTEAVAQADEAIAIITSAIAVAQAELGE